MKLKPLTNYYRDELKHCLRDGDNYYIKKYTTDGFKKSYQMWNDYSHSSIEAFFNDFMNEYPEEYLINNCNKCHQVMQHIEFDDLFDILLRRLVIDSFIGFKAEDIIREMLIKFGKKIHDYDVLARNGEIELDTKYGIDIVTFTNGEIESFFQIKNISAFTSDSDYMKNVRKGFLDNEMEANKYIGGGKYKIIVFFIYDKDAYIENGEFRFYVNPRTDKCGFSLDHLINKDGSLKLNVKHLKTKVLI